MELIRRWFSLRGRVDRRFYVLSGLGLMALKYAGDAALVVAVTGKLLSPLDYLNPVLAWRGRELGPMPEWMLAVMALWSLPFLWIGLSMSVRRANTAGRSPWFGLVFAAPVLNYLAILDLSLRPDRGSGVERRSAPPPSPRVAGVLHGLAAGVLITLSMTLLSAFVLGEYGSALFWTTPVCIGAASGFIHNRNAHNSLPSTLAVAAGALCLGALALLLFALEGLVCVLMILPLALPAAFIGALIGRALARSAGGAGPSFALLALLPLSAGVERWPAASPLYEVLSTREIDAPPAAVWPHVIAFSELPEPEDWAFRTGIAYPRRATIQGHGVGAIRRCEFSTGPFIEPITVWDAPHRLAFDVAQQPPPMHEWSPYRHVHPPHLDGYLRSRRGEFRLVPIAHGRTRLEGRTWYELSLAPSGYFAVWSHWAIHRIHARVLEHIAREVAH